MKEFEALMSRHGEQGIQAILENWERSQCLRQLGPMTIEERWVRFMGQTNDNLVREAA